MKTNTIFSLLAAGLIAGGLIATQAFAADKPASTADSPMQGRLLQRLADKLNLTADQRSQIKEVIAGEKDTLVPLATAVHDARKGLRTAIRAGDATEASVRAAAAKVAAAEADLAVERMKLYGKIAPILTDAQRRQLADLQQRADDFADNAIARIGPGLGN